MLEQGGLGYHPFIHSTASGFRIILLAVGLIVSCGAGRTSAQPADVAEHLFLTQPFENKYVFELDLSKGSHKIKLNSPDGSYFEYALEAGKPLRHFQRFVVTGFEKIKASPSTATRKDAFKLTMEDTLRKNKVTLVAGQRQTVRDQGAFFEWRLNTVETLQLFEGDTFRIPVAGQDKAIYRLVHIEKASAKIVELQPDGSDAREIALQRRKPVPPESAKK